MLNRLGRRTNKFVIFGEAQSFWPLPVLYLVEEQEKWPREQKSSNLRGWE